MFLFSPLAFSESDILIVRIDSENFWKEIIHYIIIFTARKRSLRRLCFYTCLSVILFTVGRGWYPSMHCRWYPSMPCRSSGPHPRGILGVWPGGDFQAHTRGGRSWGVWPGGSPCPHPGEVSRPTPRRVSRPTPRGSPGQTPPEQMATAADGKHPTGMHSFIFYASALPNRRPWHLLVIRAI